ncbi:hypothetical protein J0X19_07895 [Hymenobacter sp. BT186]|uniref:Uncharacterized protein n=1 Tax=Hymenobacter telluris TaxID=2816474 RepID=A0A939EXT1_9BACT|nr:hypothetical protein [Hymenobacter telluris]MBO0357863.1 hypothetical protein [Hymenobacter telluris]MBW3373890.1 hypothetical protein [Hymenobacter norwichensis]
MKGLTTLLLGTFLLAGATSTTVEANAMATTSTETAGLPEATSALPIAFKTARKPILHRPNYTYYKGDKKRKGFFKFLSFGK